MAQITAPSSEVACEKVASSAHSPLPTPNSALSSLPTRHTNPFATCWTQPGAIPFRFPAGLSAEAILEKLRKQDWRGAIVGPHGSGKSTLLETLKPALRELGWSVHSTIIRDNGQWDGELPTAQTHARIMWIIDGYEQLSRWQRFKLLRRVRRNGYGLIVTAHAPTNVPTLVELLPNEALIQSLVADLKATVSTAVTPADVTASHACHGSNVRDIFFDLYDLHERSRRVLPASNIR